MPQFYDSFTAFGLDIRLVAVVSSRLDGGRRIDVQVVSGDGAVEKIGSVGPGTIGNREAARDQVLNWLRGQRSDVTGVILNSYLAGSEAMVYAKAYAVEGRFGAGSGLPLEGHWLVREVDTSTVVASVRMLENRFTVAVTEPGTGIPTCIGEVASMTVAVRAVAVYYSQF